MAARKLTHRWILNSFGLIVGIVLLIEVLASLAIYNYYYNQARQMLQNRAELVRNTFNQYAQDSYHDDFAILTRDYVSAFSEKDKMELMLVDSSGKITVTSSAFIPDDTALPELQSVTANTQNTYWTGRLGNSERVMIVGILYPVPEQQSEIMELRLVTSLDAIDQQIMWIVLTLVSLGFTVLALVLLSSSFFLRSIVRPLNEVGDTARQIAQGNLDARLEKKGEDEIGELCEIINYMADELQATEKLKNDFISTVSHELRTPLTAIQGWGETIRSEGSSDPELLDKGMNVILGETQRLSSMVEELLDFSRLQNGRLKLVRTKIDANAELAEAALMYTQKAQREQINLVYEDEDAIAPVYGDRNRLRQVFINIIDNAIKYSDPGDSVYVVSKVENDNMVITIEDTGIGISEEDLPMVKNRFYKANFTRRGSGIGLAMADEIVTRHGGSLSVSSTQGVGTTITIVLPLYRKSDDSVRVDDEPSLSS